MSTNISLKSESLLCYSFDFISELQRNLAFELRTTFYQIHVLCKKLLYDTK